MSSKKPSHQAMTENFKRWMEQKNILRECPVCGPEGKFSVRDLFTGLCLDSTGKLTDEPSTHMVQVVCSNCKYVMLFHAHTVSRIVVDKETQ